MKKKDKKSKKASKPKVISAEVKILPSVKKSLLSKAEQMKAQLESQPKVSIMIPFERGEKKGAVQPFCINGYRFTVPKGTMTMVPEQVAEMIRDRFNIDLEVRSKSLGQQSQKVQEALK